MNENGNDVYNSTAYDPVKTLAQGIELIDKVVRGSYENGAIPLPDIVARLKVMKGEFDSCASPENAICGNFMELMVAMLTNEYGAGCKRFIVTGTLYPGDKKSKITLVPANEGQFSASVLPAPHKTAEQRKSASKNKEKAKPLIKAGFAKLTAAIASRKTKSETSVTQRGESNRRTIIHKLSEEGSE